MKRSFVITIAAAAALGVSACAADNSGQQNNTEKTTAAAAAPGASRQSSAVTSGKKTMNEKTGSLRVERGSSASYKKVSNNWFSFSMPAAWNAGTNEDEDNEYKVYEAKIFIPKKSGVKMQSYIYVSYFAEDNEDIATYQEFIRVNSQNILRKAPVEWEKYEPVTETKIAGRKAYVVARNCRHFLNPNSKDDSYVMKKEKMYVLPASKGYYVIRYAAEEGSFNTDLKAFEGIAAGFSGKY